MSEIRGSLQSSREILSMQGRSGIERSWGPSNIGDI